MAIIQTLDAVELSLGVGALRIPLAEVLERTTGVTTDKATRPDAGGAPSGPTVVAPDLGKSLQPLPIQRIALRELIEQASSGSVRVVLPLPREKMGKGPIKIDLSEGHEAIIELEVEDNIILRDTVRGTIEPPVDLPLGTTFEGLYVDDDGDVKAKIDNFVDINLTRWASAVPRIPANLDELLALAFDRKPVEEPPTQQSKKLDLSGLRVQARNVRPHGTSPLHIGGLGTILLDPETELDIEYTQERLAVKGRAVVQNSRVEGQGFNVFGLSGNALVAFELLGPVGNRALSVNVSDLDLRMETGTLVTRNGSRLEIGRSTVDDGELVIRVHPQAGMSLDAHIAHLCGEVTGGHLAFVISGNRALLQVSPTTVEGRVDVSGKQVALDLEVETEGLRMEQLDVRLGPVELDASQILAGCKGRLKGVSGKGFGFAGEVGVRAEVAGTKLALEQIAVTLIEGSTAMLQVRDFYIAPDGLSELHGGGRIELALAAGQIPLGPNSALRFRDGAQGNVEIREIRFDADDRYPQLIASVHVDAMSEPFVIQNLVELPPSHARLLGDVALDRAGDLTVENVAATLSLSSTLAAATAEDAPSVAGDAPRLPPPTPVVVEPAALSPDVTD